MTKKVKMIAALVLVVVFGIGVLTGYVTYNPVRNIYHSLRKEYEDNRNRGRDFLEQQARFEEIVTGNPNKMTTLMNGQIVKDVRGATGADDVRQIIETDEAVFYANYPEGYALQLPAGATFDFSLGHLFTKVETAEKDMEITISREYSPYDEIDEYFDFYLNRFVLDENYRNENRITLLEFEENASFVGVNANLISARLEEYDGPNTYTYVLLKTGGRTFYRFMFKYEDFDRQREIIDQILMSFFAEKLLGQTVVIQKPFEPVASPVWDEQTLSLYEEMKVPGSKIKWGFYTGRMDTTGIDEKVPEIEAAIDYKFEVLMTYFDIGMDPPIEFMKKAASQGKMIELTMHITSNSNTNMFAHTPMLDIYRGEMDDVIRDAARQLKAIDMPFLLRLNNEMNSDWTSYSGVVNLSDPAIYKEVWRRIYRIFEEEGVHNAIWIFNPNDRNYPPCQWNNYVAYFPGEDVVQMIGVTGYNTGNYYADVFGEQWRDFKDIYAAVKEEYMQYFGQYPWIITEFATSSHGGDKQKWILEMFENISDYENIKIAVWYSNPDMDFRPEYHGQIARPYMLDETPESLDAFRQGLHEYLAR